jgi:hypothetical protein
MTLETAIIVMLCIGQAVEFYMLRRIAKRISWETDTTVEREGMLCQHFERKL